MIKSPVLRYHGGKFRIADWVMSFFPEHMTYIEPFGGAAGVLLQKPRVYAEVYNDLDSAVANFFRVLRDPASRAKLIEQVVLTPYARDEFIEAWEPSDDSIEEARRLCIRAQMGFGSAGATKGVTGFRIDTKREYGTAQHIWTQYPSALAAAGQRLAGVLIENKPAIEVMQQHDSDVALHFVDPPYVHSTRVSGRGKLRYYRHEMDDRNHEELLDALMELKGYVVLSGYHSELYARRLAHWERHSIEARIAAGRGGGSPDGNNLAKPSLQQRSGKRTPPTEDVCMSKVTQIPHTRDGYRKQLIDLLRHNAYRHDIHTIWSDFVEMGAIAFSNSVDLAQFNEREAQYMRIVAKYQPEEVERFAHALGALTMAMELAGFDDLLGGVFMELELGNKWKGQFFTPYALCVLMARMNVVEMAAIEQRGFITANDPCTGGGAMIIGLANALHDAGINYQRHLHVVAQDLDIRSVHMAYLQFSLLHIPAVVIHGNTLAMEERSHWYTPAHILGNWSARLWPQEDPQPVQITPPVAEPAHQFTLFEEAA